MGSDGTKATVPVEASKPKAIRLEGYTAKDLMASAFPAPFWVVEDILPAGLTIVVGKPKFGKSIFALNLSLDVAMGNRAFGKFPTRAASVLYLGLEDTPRRLQDRLRLILNGREAPSNLHIYTHWPRFNEHGAEALDLFLSEYPDTKLVIID
ncbi:MAG: AAA family ATPase, partial [Candidatus Bathyarchaeota archaeon]|nr:AAA family ATPase [Candidatus Bathyarchaeota archaeon]